MSLCWGSFSRGIARKPATAPSEVEPREHEHDRVTEPRWLDAVARQCPSNGVCRRGIRERKEQVLAPDMGMTKGLGAKDCAVDTHLQRVSIPWAGCTSGHNVVDLDTEHAQHFASEVPFDRQAS